MGGEFDRWWGGCAFGADVVAAVALRLVAAPSLLVDVGVGVMAAVVVVEAVAWLAAAVAVVVAGQLCWRWQRRWWWRRCRGRRR